MRQLLTKRFLDLVPVLFGLSLVCFALIHLVPGDPAKLLLGPRATAEALASLHHQLGLDQPLTTQYVKFVKGAATFSFGDSIQYRRPVSSVIGPRVLPSLLLIVYSVLVAIVISVPLAIASARWRNTVIDHAVRLLTTVTFAMPPFWLGLLLILTASVRLGWLPSSGYGTTFTQHVQSLTLPALTVGLSISAPLLRSLRSTLIDNLTTEYAEAAVARGLSGRRVLLKHVLRNSLISTVTLVGLITGALVGATVVVENVFAIPGLGSIIVTSVAARDFPVVQALTLIFGVTVVVASLMTDVLYTVIDPRVRR